jgi:hypothetical protein
MSWQDDQNPPSPSFSMIVPLARFDRAVWARQGDVSSALVGVASEIATVFLIVP